MNDAAADSKVQMRIEVKRDTRAALKYLSAVWGITIPKTAVRILDETAPVRMCEIIDDTHDS